MPGSMPATSQLEWLSSTTAMIVLFWSRATRDLLRSFDWGIAALHRLDAATKLPCLAARPIASIGILEAEGSEEKPISWEKNSSDVEIERAKEQWRKER